MLLSAAPLRKPNCGTLIGGMYACLVSGFTATVACSSRNDRSKCMHALSCPPLKLFGATVAVASGSFGV